MNRITLLNRLKEFTAETVKNLILPVAMQKGDAEQEHRPANVYLMRVPEGRAAYKKAPYILHQVITGIDQQLERQPVQSYVKVRSIFTVYCEDEQEGSMNLLNLMERLRIGLLREPILGGQFSLDLEAGLETLVYPDDITPYYAGEMVTNWTIPAVEREDIRKWLQ